MLAVTGYDDRQYYDRARAGADLVLLEPCGVDLLVLEARRLLDEITGARAD